MREIEREREREREPDRQTNRQTDRQTDRQKDQRREIGNECKIYRKKIVQDNSNKFHGSRQIRNSVNVI